MCVNVLVCACVWLCSVCGVCVSEYVRVCVYTYICVCVCVVYVMNIIHDSYYK